LDLDVVTAEAYVLGGLPQVGLEWSERILAEDPSNPSARFWAVIGAAWSGANATVLEQGAEYTRRFGEFFEVYEWMAVAAVETGQREKAVALVNRAMEVEGPESDPRVMMFQAAIEWIAHGHAASLPAWRRLRDAMDARLAVEPDQSRNRALLVSALVALGERDLALHHCLLLEKAFEDPDGPAIVDSEDYAYAFAILGRRDAALRLLNLLAARKQTRQSAGLGRLLADSLGAPRDSMFVSFERECERTRQEFLARYGNP
jgi:hypothetical protein